ncbi:MAG TPA: hypothetical protein VGF52_07050 [Tepidisphaeraceae bacterium]
MATVRAVSDAVGRGFELALAGDAQTLRAILEKEPAPMAVMVDMSVVQVDAIKLLDSARGIRSSVRRILLTDFCDLNIIVQGLHTGAIERIVYKPIYAPEVLGALGVQIGAAQMVPSNVMHHSRAAG